ncbi:hypothetical protein E4U43_006448 [Claviceps pusilla]|uniref:Uncharacterized protein n=1 Tax=Claviceps pusilla TaxID=123648 RepID=A0A9P7NFN8_9HYPO|nr:hypothetical protein E4U43_006448 [Claviceps pusilla]
MTVQRLGALLKQVRERTSLDPALASAFPSETSASPPSPLAFLTRPAPLDRAQPMSWTSENVGREFGITRDELDELDEHSECGLVKGPDGESNEVSLTKDDGIRPGTTSENLAEIRAAFLQWGPTWSTSMCTGAEMGMASRWMDEP